MKQGSRILSVLVLFSMGSARLVDTAMQSPPPRPESYIVRWDADPESLLAAGGTISLRCADTFALELIPGISDVTASNLAALATKRAPRLLEGAHGIGAARARKLAPYLTVDEPCIPPKDRYDLPKAAG